MADETKLRELAQAATPGPWELWDGCSWRRFGSAATGRTVCEPIKHPHDGTPDLHFNNRHDAAWIAAANPATVLALLDELDNLKADNWTLLQSLNGEANERIRLEGRCNALLAQRKTLAKTIRSAVTAVAYASERDHALDEAYEALDGAVREIAAWERQEAGDAGR